MWYNVNQGGIMEDLDKKELETIQSEIVAIQPKIGAVIKTAEDATNAGKVAQLVKAGKAKISEFFEPRKKRARAVWQDWLDAEKDALKPWEAADAAIRASLTDYERVEREKREEAVRKAREKAEAQAEKKTEKTGVVHEAAPVADASKVKVDGLKFREDWKFEIEDAEKIPAMFMIPDEKAIRAYVSSKKDKANIPGVRVYSVKTPVV